MDTTKARELLNQRDAIDRELAELFTGSAPKKPITCGHCKQEGHSARTCPTKS